MDLSFKNDIMKKDIKIIKIIATISLVLILLLSLIYFLSRHKIERYFLLSDVVSSAVDQSTKAEFKKYFTQDQVRIRLMKDLSHIANLDLKNDSQKKIFKLFRHDIEQMYKNVENSTVLQRQFQDSVLSFYRQKLMLFSILEFVVDGFKKEHGFLPGDSKKCKSSELISNENGVLDKAESSYFWSCLKEYGLINDDFDENDFLKPAVKELSDKLPQNLLKFIPQPEKIAFVAGNFSAEDRSGNAIKAHPIMVYYAKVLSSKPKSEKVTVLNDGQSFCLNGGYYGNDPEPCVIYRWLD